VDATMNLINQTRRPQPNQWTREIT
jgi:hypothetical protein